MPIVCRVGIYGKVFTMVVRATLIKDLISLNVKFKPSGSSGGRLLLVSQSNKLYMSTTSTTKRLYGTVTTLSSDVLFDSYENITREVINKLLVKQGHTPPPNQHFVRC